METWPYKCLYSIRSLDHMETWSYKCLYCICLLDHMETWPYRCLYSIRSLDHMETWPYICLYSIRYLDCREWQTNNQQINKQEKISRTVAHLMASFTAPFNNTRNLKFISPPTVAFFVAVNHNLNIFTSAINGP